MPFKITGKITQYNFDTAGFRKTVDEQIQLAMRQAARAWLRAVIARVPVYTGTAAGSLQPLARFLRVALPIRPAPNAKGRPGGPDVGARQQLFSFDNNGRGSYSFNYQTFVRYMETNSYYHVPLPLTHPTPWNAFQEGEKAFNDYLKSNLPGRIPKLSKFIGTKVITLRS